MTDQENQEFVRAFARGLEVIKAFGEGARELTLSDVAKRANVSRAAARRLLSTLLALKYAGTDGKRFWLTPRTLDLGYSYLSSMETWSVAQEHMEELVQRVHESCSISVLDGNDIVYVVRVPTRRILKSSLNVGSRIPAHAISMGRIQLAALSPAELDEYFATARFHQYTRYTVTDPEKLRRLIVEDGQKGWSLVDRELEEGICGIAVPITDRNNKTIAAMNLSMNPERAAAPGVLDRLLGELQETARHINTVLRVLR